MNPVSALLVNMRPRQWTKNLFVFIPVLFDQRSGTEALERSPIDVQ